MTMSSQGRLLLVATAIAMMVLGLSILGSRASTADAAKLTACVSKKTGAVQILLGKKAKGKCRKGSKKISLDDGNGRPVVDAKGRRVGTLVGTSEAGPYAIFQVLRNGGIYNYMGGGALFPTDLTSGGAFPVNYKTADCSGKAYITSAGFPPASFVNLLKNALRGQFRAVNREFTGSGFGTPKAFTGDGTTENVAVAITTYEINSSGICVVDTASFTGILYGMRVVSIPKPIDFTGPLRIR